jgi:hypothetical protein
VTAELDPRLRLLLDSARRAGPPAETRARLRLRWSRRTRAASWAGAGLGGTAGLLLGALIAVVSISDRRPLTPPAVALAARNATPTEPDSECRGEPWPVPAAALPHSAPRPLPARPARAIVKPPPAPVPDDSLSAEIALLSSARAALTHDPPAALSLAIRHERDFPHGVLVQERESIRVEAICRTRPTEGSAALARFQTQWPASAQLARLMSVCGR